MKPCASCGQPFKPGYRQPGRMAQRFCSKRCAQIKHKPKKCRGCKAVFQPRNMRQSFCTVRCLSAYQKANLFVEVTCAQCARIFRRRRMAAKRHGLHFCNKVCQHKYLRMENSPHWRGGHDPNRGPAWRKLAAEIRKRDEYMCRRCGRTQEENGQRLDVDHIVPWREFPGRPDIANDPRNLVSLCKRCHTHKTAVAERAYLRGDCYEMGKYEHAISLPPLLRHYPETTDR